MAVFSRGKRRCDKSSTTQQQGNCSSAAPSRRNQSSSLSVVTVLRRHPERSEGSLYFVFACFTPLPILKEGSTPFPTRFHRFPGRRLTLLFAFLSVGVGRQPCLPPADDATSAAYPAGATVACWHSRGRPGIPSLPILKATRVIASKLTPPTQDRAEINSKCMSYFQSPKNTRSPTTFPPQSTANSPRFTSTITLIFAPPLLCSDYRFSRDHRLLLLQKVAFIPQCAVKLPSQLGGLRSKSRPSTLQKNYRNNPPIRRISIRPEPPKPRPVIRAGPRLPHHRKLIEISSQRPRRTIVHRRFHPDRNLRNQRSDVQHSLHF